MNITRFLSSSRSKKPFLAVIGHPIGHSLSPLIHNEAIIYHGLPAAYHAIDCPAADYHLLPHLMRNGYFRGANVTIPLKQDIMGYLDETDSEAFAIGAVNTVVAFQPEDDSMLSAAVSSETGRIRLEGHNTDAFGFLKPLEKYGHFQTALILGSGGAMRAVRYALMKTGVKSIYIASRFAGKSAGKDRNPNTGNDQSNKTSIHDSGEASVRSESGEASVHPESGVINEKWVSYTQIREIMPECELIVNTTPVGMYPGITEMPLTEAMLGDMKGKVCYDLIYNPVETRLIQTARSLGAETISGMEMFFWQASRSFELWFNLPMPANRVRKVLEEQGMNASF